MFVRKMNSPQRAAVLATTTHTRQKGLSRHRCGQVSAFWPWDRVAWEARQTLTTLEATRPDRGCARATEPRSIGSWSDAISLVAALFRAVKDAAARLAALGPPGHP